MKLLITGGAGYIGSHVVRQLGEKNHDIVVYDDLSTGFSEAVLHGKLIVGGLSDRHRLRDVFADGQFEAVLHFAASVVAPESVHKPLKYYANNVCNTLGLLELCAEHGVDRFVFSSSAAVYGNAGKDKVTEEDAIAPINPYGASKAMVERIIMDHAAASKLRYVILRYFNVAGAEPKGRIGQSTPNATHLIKVACQAALGIRPAVEIFGVDYPTPDGTCIRDYIHVEDLAQAHVDALNYLADNGDSLALNVGYGRGYSVREVIDVVRKVSSRDFPIRVGNRRPGDPHRLVSSNLKIIETLSWRPVFDNLEAIVTSAHAWEKKLMQQDKSN